MEASPLLGTVSHSPQRSKDSLTSSGNHSSSVAASSRYSVNVVDEPYDEFLEPLNVPENSNLVKRPSMYHSESATSDALTSRRQNLLKRRSKQLLQQVEENTSITSSTKEGTSRPKFVVTNPDPVLKHAAISKSSSSDNDDLKNFVDLMNKDDKLTHDDIQQLRSLGKLPTTQNRMSALSNYSGVVEEVEEVHQINPDKSLYIPSLVDIASTVNKQNQNSESPSRESSFRSSGAGLIDVVSIKSLDSLVGVGPLPTTGALDNSDSTRRAPDLSRSTEIDPIIPPRSNRRPRSEMWLSSTVQTTPNQQGQGQTRDNITGFIKEERKSILDMETPTRTSTRSTILGRRISLPPPSIDLPLTPSQLKELEAGGIPQPNKEYASLIKRKVTELRDGRRISSLNRPLPEIPRNSDDDDDDNNNMERGHVKKEHLKQESIKDQSSESLLLRHSDEQGRSIISSETVQKKSFVKLEDTDLALSIHSPLNSDQETPVFNKPMPIIDPTSSPPRNRGGDDNDDENEAHYKYSANAFSPVSMANTDNASFHTANDVSHDAIREVIITDDISQYENDENYEEIPISKSGAGSAIPKKLGKKHHKKKSSSSSTGNKKLRPFSISTLSKLLESTDGVIIGEEFDSLNISQDEKKYIEKIVDVIARLTADMVADPSRHDGTIDRMKAALRILEGFEQV